jgi:predicted dehydrogenase
VADFGIAVVGAGRISTAHAPAIAAAPGTRLVGVYDTDQSAASVFAQQYLAPRVFATWDELLGSPDVRMVAVLLPHHLHARFAIEALSSGRDVVVEKPLATSLSEADQMLDAAARAGRQLFAVQNRVYDPGIELARDLVTGGAIGEIFLAQTSAYESDGAHRARPWLRSDQQGVLMAQAVHEAYLLRWLVGDVHAVTCHYASASPVRMAGPHTAVVALEFRGGAVGEMTATFAAVHGPSEHSVTLFGSGGYVQAMRRWVPGTPRLTMARRGFSYSVSAISPARFGDSDLHMLEVPDGEAFHRMWADFVASVATGKPPQVTGQDGRSAIEVMLAADRAAREKTRVVLPL